MDHRAATTGTLHRDRFRHHYLLAANQFVVALQRDSDQPANLFDGPLATCVAESIVTHTMKARRQHVLERTANELFHTYWHRLVLTRSAAFDLQRLVGFFQRRRFVALCDASIGHRTSRHVRSQVRHRGFAVADRFAIDDEAAFPDIVWNRIKERFGSQFVFQLASNQLLQNLLRHEHTGPTALSNAVRVDAPGGTMTSTCGS